MSFTDKSRGELYRDAADAVTYSRTFIGKLVAINTITGDRLLPKKFRHRSSTLAGSVAVLGIMDKLDGILARQAEKNGVPISKIDKEKDPVEDKKYTRWMMGAIATRELISGVKRREPTRIVFAGLIGINLLAIEDRDERMKQSRSAAIEGADTGAIKINKYKTGLQNVAHTLASSPLANTGFGQTMITGIYSMSTFMGEVGYRIADRIHRGEHLSENIQANKDDLGNINEVFYSNNLQN